MIDNSNGDVGKTIFNKIQKIGFTGAPCSGKSTAISQVMEFVSSLGIPVTMALEAVTDLKKCGIKPENFEHIDLFQKFVIEEMIHRESIYSRALYHMMQYSKAEKGIVLCDRGFGDLPVYAQTETLVQMFANHQINFDIEKFARYALVILMEVAPEEHYTCANNVAREEGYPEAVELDKLTAQAWNGHHNIVKVGNDYGDFSGKVNAVIQNVAQLVGVPKPLTIERKYLVSSLDSVLENFLKYVEAVPINIVQHYLLRNNEERVRAWTRGDVTTYFHTIKSNEPGIERIKTERVISRCEYDELLVYADPKCAPIEKTRHCFINSGQYFRLDTFHHDSAWHLLEVQPTVIQENVILPDCLSFILEVTNNPGYYNYSIAKELANQRSQFYEQI